MQVREVVQYASLASAVDALSDHSPLYAVLTLPSEHVRRKRLHRPLGKTKWRAYDEERMKVDIAQEMGTLSQVDLESLRKIMEKHAVQSGFVPTF
jgi:hypothetical protein